MACSADAAVHAIGSPILSPHQNGRTNGYQAHWMSSSQPTEVKRKMIERMGHSYLEKSAQVQYHEIGMRSIV